MKMFECEKFVLANGLRTYIMPMQNMPTVLTLVLVKGGSRFETPEKNGISHFMEHMFFKGGRKYPNSMALGVAIDAFGARHNAYTGKEVVGYYVEHGVSAGNLGYDILEDMFINAAVPEDAINIERGTILGELRGARDNDEEMLFSFVCKELLYGIHSLSRDPLGTEETLADIRREDLIKYRNAFYKSQNMVICVVGNVDIFRTKRELKDRFEGIPQGPSVDFQLFDPETRPKQRVCVLPKKEREQAHILLVSPTTGYSHEDKYALNILAVALGVGSSSRLFQQVREKRGLAYYISVHGSAHYETGSLFSYWGVNHDKIAVSTEIVLDEYKRIREEYLEEQELEKVKGWLVGSKEISFSRISAVAQDYGNYALLLGEPEFLNISKEKIYAVTKEDVLRAAQKYLCPENLKIGMTAQEKFCDKEKLQKILEKAR